MLSLGIGHVSAFVDDASASVPGAQIESIVVTHVFEDACDGLVNCSEDAERVCAHCAILGDGHPDVTSRRSRFVPAENGNRLDESSIEDIAKPPRV